MTKEAPQARPRLVIIGGGFAGLNLAKKTDKKKFEVIIVDTNNYHSFPPLFYQLASGGLDPGSISFPFRREMRKGSVKGVSFHLGEVSEIDFETRVITTQFEKLKYDILVIAAGSTNNFFGNDSLIERVYTMKTVPEAIRVRDAVLRRMERAAICPDAAERRRMLSFVVVGGGPTGVEIAGALGEMKRYILRREYPTIALDELSITLLEGADKLLGAMSPTASRKSLEYLGRLLVDVRLGERMESYEGDTITLGSGETIPASMVIWTAGVSAPEFCMTGLPQEAAGHAGRFVVGRDCKVAGLEDVYAIGDISLMATPDSPRGLPQLAQVAIQQARYLGKCLNGKEKGEFKYRDPGTMATVGRNLAVADLGRIHLSGFFAWLAWMFIHLMSLLGMRNKITVLINWIWSYCSYPTSLRLLIIPAKWPRRGRQLSRGDRCPV